jgi:hypothetical protein
MAGRPRPPVRKDPPRPGRLSSIFSERNFLLGLMVLFIVMTIWVASVPYDPIKGDIADASTNAIWSEYYKEGKFAVTYDQWKADNRSITQSSVIEKDGKVYIVNEKGPAHAIFTMVLGKATGTVFAAVATIATYMLGRRIFNWKVGAIASLFVLTDISIIVMWYKDYWVDASTVHLLILAMWLFVESGLKMKAYFEKKDKRALKLSVMLGIAAGISFGASIATRYTVAIVLVPAIVYIFVTFGKPLVHWIKHRDLKGLGGTIGHMVVYLLPFLLGLLIVLIPLMNYNNTYFGGPFKSGYDAASLVEYARSPSAKVIARNQSDYLATDPLGKVDLVLHNAGALAPVMLERMMFLVFVPIAIWKLWKRPIFWLLLLWGLVIMIGFYSMSWVDRYATMAPPWEPRYQMPALPAFALLGAQGLYTLAKGLDKAVHGLKGGFAGPVFAIVIVGLIVFLNVAPTEQYFHDARLGNFNGTPKNKGPPGGGGGGGGAPVVTIMMVYTNGQNFNDKLLQVNGGHVVAVHTAPNGQVQGFDMTDPSTSQNLTVAFLDYPSGTVPPVKVGSKVMVNGMFKWQDKNSNGKVDVGEPVLTVKYLTQDKVTIEK